MNARMAILLVTLAAPLATANAGEFAAVRFVPVVLDAPPANAPAVVNAQPYPVNVQPPVVHGPPLAVNAQPYYVGNAPVLAPHAPATPSPLAAHAAEPKAGGQFWFEAEALLAWLDSGRAPALVTTTSAVGLPTELAGALFQPGTQVLFGDAGIGQDARLGMHLRLGYQLDGRCREGLEVGIISIGREGETFELRSNGTQVLSRPFFNAQTNTEQAGQIAGPTAPGSVRVRTASDLIGTEVNVRRALACLGCESCCESGEGCPRPGCGGSQRSGGWLDAWDVDFLAGYRSLRYRDKLTVNSTTQPTDGITPISNISDSFYARSMFHGAQVGLDARLTRGDLYLDVRGMAAVGQRTSRVDVNGFTEVVQAAQVPTRLRGGFLASPSNIGVYLDEDFTYVGELSLRAGYKISENLRVSFGYTGLYFGSVIRTSDLVDRTVNIAQLPSPAQPIGMVPAGTPARPAVIIEEGDIWAHALSFGFELRY